MIPEDKTPASKAGLATKNICIPISEFHLERKEKQVASLLITTGNQQKIKTDKKILQRKPK